MDRRQRDGLGTAGKTLFYPIWVSMSGRRSLMWGKPCDAPSEAKAIGRAQVDAGKASLSFVVRFGDGAREPMPQYVHPQSARKIIEHWESLWDATERPDLER